MDLYLHALSHTHSHLFTVTHENLQSRERANKNSQTQIKSSYFWVVKQNNLLTLTSFLNFPLYLLFFLPTKALRRKHKSTLTHVNMLALAHKQTLLSIFAFSWTRQFFFISPFPVCKLPFSSFHSHTTHAHEHTHHTRTYMHAHKCTHTRTWAHEHILHKYRQTQNLEINILSQQHQSPNFFKPQIFKSINYPFCGSMCLYLHLNDTNHRCFFLSLSFSLSSLSPSLYISVMCDHVYACVCSL